MCYVIYQHRAGVHCTVTVGSFFSVIVINALLDINFKTIDNTNIQSILKRFIHAEKGTNYLVNMKKCKKPTAPSVPRRSPIQVLTRLNVA